MLKPLIKKTIVDEIIKTILDMIEDQTFKPGEKLMGERELAQQLNVSRTSIREALKALSFVKVVIIKPGDGTYLSDNLDMLHEIHLKYDPKMIRKGIEYNQILESRMIFEPTVARMAAQRATSENIIILRKSFSVLKRLIEEDKMPEYQVEDLHFHKLIALATQNKFLSDIVNSLMDNLLETHLPKDRAQETLREHEQILMAIEKGDPDEAEKKAADHLKTVSKNLELIKLLESNETSR